MTEGGKVGERGRGERQRVEEGGVRQRVERWVGEGGE